jgi:hypothetical protein
MTHRMRKLRGLALAALTVASLGVGLGGWRSAPKPAPGRPIVLVVHGRGLLDRDSAALRTEWTQALRRGTRNLGVDGLLGDDDVRLVWYADLLDSRSGEECETRASGGRERGASGKRELQQVAEFAGVLFGALAEMVADSQSAPLRSIAGDLRYLASPGTRCAVERRLLGAVDAAAREGRPVVLVAHSLGSVVAYRTLRERTEELRAPDLVQQFVTIGSPLGSGELRTLLLGEGDERGLVLPGRVRAWINVRDPNDGIAAHIDSVAGRKGERVRVREVMTSPAPTSDLAHDLGRYLTDPGAARAVAGAWCAAFGEKGKQPKGCGELR